MNTRPPEDWNDLNAAEDEATGLELPPPRKQRRMLLPVLLVLSLAALAGGWFGPFNPWPPAPGQDDLARGRKAALQLAEKAVNDYQRRNGRYPARLEEAITLPSDLGVEYVPRESGFDLRAAGGNTP